ncbi:hypothetical protein GCM10010992_14720 [Cloacibacterium rupense]|uniref:Thioredoxin domain-containing protein n=1 Tax=Cloacibacterium rupense TaxID=517423 RepID=A0ABQ2NI82_9FLAO|nr:TlpA disulfide reductase family protein [Cloacibacterium rupense]GGP04031.1 hypothetical protein GCM10010992_14720 [Cloacibacterium rupense]
MKKITILFTLLSILSFSQNSKIYPKNKVVSGKENVFIYEPEKGINVPDNVYANYISSIGERKSPLKKVNSKYEFTIKLPDSIKTVMMIFKNNNETYTDKNEDKAFTYYLKNTKNGEPEADRLILMEFANYVFKLNYPDAKLSSEFENLFKTYPKLKDYSETYFKYLIAVNKANPEKGKLLSEKYAKELENKEDENSLVKAIFYYRNANNFDKEEQLSKIILEKYPKGLLAKSKFSDSFFDKIRQPDFQLDETIVNQFISEFQKYSKHFYDIQTIDQIRTVLLKKAIEEKNWERIEKFEKEISNNWLTANLYNETAWKLADGDRINSEGKDLDFAEKLARKSLEIYSEKINTLNEYDAQSNYDQKFMFYTDALGMILYKQKRYQEAFAEQSKFINFDFIDDSNRERYVLSAEKVKGNDFVKNYIYNLLKENNISDNLYHKLSEIYQSQNLPTQEIEKLRTENKKIATKKAQQELYKYYGGDLKAKDFSLTNLEGKTVKLSDYKGKIVVLDFWGTWCGPCRSSLPHMQELVNQYKGKDVEFFFVDVQENKKPEDVKKTVAKFISDNKYTFNVLLDLDDKVAQSFKIKGVPCEIIINKEGNIISRSEGYDGNLGALIAENL